MKILQSLRAGSLRGQRARAREFQRTERTAESASSLQCALSRRKPARRLMLHQNHKAHGFESSRSGFSFTLSFITHVKDLFEILFIISYDGTNAFRQEVHKNNCISIMQQ